MSNYKFVWLKLSDECIELRKKDFSSCSEFKVEEINPLLEKRLGENGISVKVESFRKQCWYVLTPIDTNWISIKAPLYEFNVKSGKYELITESFAGSVNDPTGYEFAKETYLRCCKEVADEQAKVFEDLFNERTLDGISSIVTISINPYREPNYFYEEYIPEGYIKVCERYLPFLRERYEYVFIKNINAEGKNIKIRIPDFYKGLVIGKEGENIKRIARMINARKIKVI